MLANLFIPFTAVLPTAQVALLLVIVIIEALVIRRYTDPTVPTRRLWASVTGANIITTLIGVALVFPLMWLEARLAFGWGSQYREHPLLWWFSCIIYGFFLPYSFLIFCYVA